MYRFHALKIQDKAGSWSPIDGELWSDFLEVALLVDGEVVSKVLGGDDYADLQFEDGFILPAAFRGHLEVLAT